MSGQQRQDESKNGVERRGSLNSLNSLDSDSGGALQELFFDGDFNGLFDDDAADDLSFDPQEVMEDLNRLKDKKKNKVSESKDEKDGSSTDSPSDKPSNSSNKKRTSIDESEGNGKRPRSNIVPEENQGHPPPLWHSEAADKQHRQSMILEIARLLQARKASVPSNEWLQQLPHKAMKLEGRLYRTAPSLEAYLDRSTLKNRLKRLASVIMRQYRSSKGPNGQRLPSILSRALPGSGTRSSIVSQSTVASIASSQAQHRDSIASQASLDSLRSLQQSMREKSSLAVNSKGTEHQAQNGGNHYANGKKEDATALKKAAESVQSSDVSNGAPEGSRLLSRGTSVGSHNNDMTQTQLRQQKLLLNQKQQRTSNPISSMTQRQALQIEIEGLATVGSAANATTRADTSESIEAIERQRAVNAHLQQQIMDNIRRQEDLVQRLQGNEQQIDQQGPEQRTTSSKSSLGELTSIQQGQASQSRKGMSVVNQAPPNSSVAAALQLQANMNTGMSPQIGQFMAGGGLPLVPSNMLMAQAALLNSSMNQHNALIARTGMTLQQQLPGFGLINNNIPLMGLGNPNMVAEVLRFQQEQSGSMTPQQQRQLQMLQSSARGNNSSGLATMQVMHQGNHNNIGNGFHPGVPPSSNVGAAQPSSNQSSNERRSGSTSKGTHDHQDNPLSPGSFKW